MFSMTKQSLFIHCFSLILGFFFLICAVYPLYKIHDPEKPFIYTKSTYSDYQIIECVGKSCTIHYYDSNEKELCKIKTKEYQSTEGFKPQKVKIYYDDKSCSYSSFEYTESLSSIFISIFLLSFAICIIISIKNMFLELKHSIRFNKTIEHFKTHKPIIIDSIKYTSGKKNDILRKNSYVHKINVDVQIPGSGSVNIKDRIHSRKQVIKSISVIVDPNDTTKYIITDDSSAKREYDKFIQKWYGKR